MKKTKRLTVFIGRFSPFHNGHAEVLKRALETSNLVLVLIGSSGQARTTKNPFTFAEREQMINCYYAQNKPNRGTDYDDISEVGIWGDLVIAPIYDHPYNNQVWIRGVQDAVEKVRNERARMSDIQVYLTGCDRDQSTWYLNAFGDYFKADFITNHSAGLELSATKVRKILFAEDGRISELKTMVPPSTLDFLSDFQVTKTEAYNALLSEYRYIEKYKAAYAKAPYPVSIQTVDTVVIQSGHILVCVRDNFPGKGLWCVPGGHLDVDKNERLIDAAIRELIEETRIEFSPNQPAHLVADKLKNSIRSKECFDAPERSLKGRVITMAYLLKLDDSKPLPKVRPQHGEIKKVMWIPISEALSLKNMDKWFDDHYHIVHTLYGRIPTND